MPTNVLIDCDPGHDDAIALLLAFARPELEVAAVTVVAGNQTLPKTTTNALRVLTLAGRTDVPVAAGMREPMTRSEDRIATPEVHGESGLDGPELPEPESQAVNAHAVDVIRDAAREGPVTIVPVGPLSNVGMALRQYPDITEGIEEIVLMGDAVGVGNWSPAAEFNILADPEAAEIVFESGVPVTMVGLDVTREAQVEPAHIERFRSHGSEVGEVVAGWLDFFIQYHQRQYEWDGVPIHDALAVGHLLEEDLLTTEHLRVDVETRSEMSAGRTVADVHEVTGREPNAHVAREVDREAFVDVLYEAVEGYGA